MNVSDMSYTNSNTTFAKLIAMTLHTEHALMSCSTLADVKKLLTTFIKLPGMTLLIKVVLVSFSILFDAKLWRGSFSCYNY